MEIHEILLASGWHKIEPGSYSTSTADEFFAWELTGKYRLSGPISSVLAFRSTD